MAAVNPEQRPRSAAVVEKRAAMTLRWQVADGDSSSFCDRMQRVLGALAGEGISAVLQQPVSPARFPPIWELRLEAQTFASLAAVLDRGFTVTGESLLDQLLVAAAADRQGAAGEEPTVKLVGSGELFRAWSSRPPMP